ncbi:MAG: hypothetical protein A2498_07305 [Lentisphaerae bacterium RIFOXYC12_FULL_60_16]|nr:MAG: hypothetical protein A2498_07305 [Lentisphaerae bacterium RIFOXYC12_FULL_60_16]
MSRTRYYVTTPIYYVNDKPHIGHAYTTVLADVMARYHRLFGVPTFFLTGTDEHGQKVQQAAQKAGVDPQTHVDRTVVRFQHLWQQLGITNDAFIRTTDAGHKRVVQEILQDLYDRDEIYRAEYDGWYCVTCERFYMEKDLLNGTCPEAGCGRKVEPIRETNYFFRMSRYQEWLVDYIQTHPSFIQPDFRRNETLGFLRKPLQDLCISRPKSRLNWGVELPFDSQFVCYVWFDALVNYISAIGYRSDPALFERWWPASHHLIGKDILTTHTVYWPTMLKAMRLPMPETVFAHGWWLSGQDKMSKSLGNVVNPFDYIERFGVDAFRYFLTAEMSLGQDASFTEVAFMRRYQADLANDLGNLLSRVVKLIGSHCGGRVPSPGTMGEDEVRIRDVTLAAAKDMVDAVERMRVDQGVTGLTNAIREANRYLERRQPWVLARDGRQAELETVLYAAAECLRIVSGMLFPVMPTKMGELRAVLGVGTEAPSFDRLREWGGLVPGTPVSAAPILFPRQESKPTPVPAATPVEVEGVMSIEYTDFQKVELRTAKIVQAERVEGADKLLRLQVEIGGEARQIVAGIAKFYAPETLIGRTIVVVANLKPAKIRGVESNGMLLAASKDDVLRLVTVDGEMVSGATVK